MEVIFMANGITLSDPGDTTEVKIYRDGENIAMKPGTAGAAVLPDSDNDMDLGDGSHRWRVMYGVATSTRYADLAEKYSVKGDIKPGDVVEISLDEDVDCEKCNTVGTDRVLGVVSTNPGIRMNEDADGEFIALRGRVPCKVMGPITKGDNLIAYTNGFAIAIVKSAYVDPSELTTFAKALQSFDSTGPGIIEVVVL